MSKIERYRCLNCGRRFETEVLTPEEQQEAKRQGRALCYVACPECRRTDIRFGWD